MLPCYNIYTYIMWVTIYYVPYRKKMWTIWWIIQIIVSLIFLIPSLEDNDARLLIVVVDHLLVEVYVGSDDLIHGCQCNNCSWWWCRYQYFTCRVRRMMNDVSSNGNHTNGNNTTKSSSSLSNINAAAAVAVASWWVWDLNSTYSGTGLSWY